VVYLAVYSVFYDICIYLYLGVAPAYVKKKAMFRGTEVEGLVKKINFEDLVQTYGTHMFLNNEDMP
jgi:hypothetical protein